uniref:DNA repair protein RecN n=1 Tax=Candidatus Kentrum eta TaxID=2126337 RepID=A0A450UVZ1_9GAMM|nr:MAG: DNA repair protein RecN (Recombination protein N) [Candidatus Kentron sp. H]VFJ97246.1 MAG: DNA repair protein RecN (Recombination protein N) [Candidatus Kentron sp. H]VFK02754.1 MAG: DNA repair protein RecN (Recombination protein N) [Candidatus Kentron sp. H]
MLVHLTVRDFAIVEQLALSIQTGMTVMTGETGAGKSILVDALGLALGGRASSRVVRAGCPRAEVSAVFDLSHQPAVRKWLREQALDEGEGDGGEEGGAGDDVSESTPSECILRRTVTADGRARALINNRPVPVRTLRELGARLVDIHGQHAHQSLLEGHTQRDIIDAYGGNEADRGEIARVYRQWKAKNEQITHHTGNDGEDQDARLEWLRFQVEELRNLNPEPHEPASLDEEHRRLGHAAEITGACHAILDKIGSEPDNAALTRIETALRHLEGLCAYDKRLEESHALLDTAAIHLKEGIGALEHYIGHLQVDEARLGWIESRLAALHDMARKHRIPPGELTAFLGRLEEEIGQIEQSAALLATLHHERAELERQYRELALGLREKRTQAGIGFSREVTANLQQLGMPGGQMAVAISPRDDEHFTPTGPDEVAFRVSLNPGQPPKPLAQVASGGELSRIALAIQVIVTAGATTPTLIFDEVDAGIGGRVAEIVGKHLRGLGGARQVLCITHLPQVASQAHRHVKVQKHVENDVTKTNLVPLTEEARVREIARMLGGVAITDRTLAHAREMVEGHGGADRK